MDFEALRTFVAANPALLYTLYAGLALALFLLLVGLGLALITWLLGLLVSGVQPKAEIVPDGIRIFDV